MLSTSYTLSLHRSQAHQSQSPSLALLRALAYTVPSSFTSGWFLFATWAAGRPVHLSPCPSFPQQHLWLILTLPQGQAPPVVCISLHSRGPPGACCSLDPPCVCAKSLLSCSTLCDPIDCSPPGSSVCGILQARILEWVAISFSRGSSQPRDRTWVCCIAGRCFIL